MFTRMAAILVLVLLPVCLVGCLVPSDREIAARIETAINGQLHPKAVAVTLQRNSIFSSTVRQLDITITGFSADTLPFTIQGPAPRVVAARADAETNERLIRVVDTHIHCADFRVKGMPVQRLELTLHEMRVPAAGASAGQFAISSAESANCTAAFTDANLTQFLRLRKLPMAMPTVHVTTHGCQVRGTLPTFLRASVEVSGRIAYKKQAILYLQNPTIRIQAVRIPTVIANRVLKQINPLTDLNTDFPLPVPLTITKVEHAKGLLRCKGILHFPGER